MEYSNNNLLIAFLCDQEGVITEVVRNELNKEGVFAGRLWSSTVHQGSTIKALNFLRQIKKHKVVSDWSINIDTNGQIQSLHFTGWLVGEQIYIVGSQTSLGVDDAYLAGLLSINNEQVNFIRAFIKEYQTNLQTSNKREIYDLDEFSRLNNELVTLQRELVRKNSELEENRQLIKHILETTPEIIFIYDFTKRKSIFVNQLIEQVLGYLPEGGEETNPSISDPRPQLCSRCSW